MFNLRTAAFGLAIAGAAVLVVASPSAGAGDASSADPTTTSSVPCVRWQNTNPSAYVEVCPPLAPAAD